ncbi:S8 family peptidase [Deinococcus marmoris]|uniref:S8 family peptidase n=1 Tax=Deinococcus marmoris TaxID=249408 RepID=UPI0004951919|nr:S8 family serine peptidase [Deinococcus marmoris]
MPRRVLMPALLLSLLLTACVDQPPAPEPKPKPDPVEPPAPAACRTLGAAGAGVASVEGLSGQRLEGQWSQAKSDWSAARVPGQVLVLQGSAGGDLSGDNLSAQALRALSGVQMQAVVPGVQLARTPAGEDDRAFAGRLAAAGLRTQPNYVYRALALPNDPAFPGNAGLEVKGVNVFQTYLTRSGVPAAWDVLKAAGKTPRGASVAVLDSAPDRSHPELQGRLEAGVSCLAAGPETGAVTGSEHGTEVAGLIGANTSNGVGLAGVVWSGPITGIEVLDRSGSGSTVDLTAGLNYAAQQGARVINISLGAPGIDDAVLGAALTAAAKTAVIVAAAGNSANEGVYYPASHPDVIAVGALGSSDGALACYSARPNPQLPRALDIVAPGGVGGRCPGFKPELDIPVLAVGDRVEDQYRLEAGTSFSAPLVSGVVALMRGANPGLSAEQTRTLVLANVNRSGGLPVLDAAAAVRAALR